MQDISLGEMILRLALAALLGALIGAERETHGHPAGLRTHILVCLGSALFTLSSFLVAGTQYDPGRITAQIVTGVGFLGAGTIIHRGSVVRGLTTAASIWTIAAVGVAVGIGGTALFLAVAASAIVFATLTLLPKLENLIYSSRDEKTLVLTVKREDDGLSQVLTLLAGHDVRIEQITREDSRAPETMVVSIRFRIGSEYDEDSLVEDIQSSDRVVMHRWT